MAARHIRRKDANLDFQDIGLRIASIGGRYLLNTCHLHYGYWPPDLPVELMNMRRAQEIYTDFLISHIPPRAKSVLDVGCGTGGNAHLLLEHGFEVDCVSPSDLLSDETRRTLEGRGKLYRTTFEKLVPEKKYDCVLFSESFQYVELNKVFPQIKRCLAPDGIVLIADFFRIPAKGSSPLGGGHRLRHFRAALEKSPYKAISEEDITEFTAPNLQLVDEFLREVAIPARDLLLESLSGNYPVSFRIVSWVAKLFFKRRLAKLEYKYFSGERNQDNFKKYKRYLVFVLKQT
ncbi:MAG: class I SAM-dependent methyltransferase [Victivallaceae bacterium]|nr:class I SAM-dependent methyltransferase [Victivallaceae bacterium]